MKVCYNCGAEIGFNECYYRVTKQKLKFRQGETIGCACENCVENEDAKVCFKLWKGDVLPETLQ